MERNENDILKDRVLSNENIVEELSWLQGYLVDISAVINEDTELMRALRIVAFSKDLISDYIKES